MSVVLVTGGASSIGSHACKALAEAGHTPVTYDNFKNGWRDAVKFGPAEDGNLLDHSRLRDVIERWRPDAVMHFAALIEATAEVTGRSVPHEVAGRRDGDLASLVCGSSLAKEALGWHAQRSSLPQMIADAWNLYQNGHYAE